MNTKALHTFHIPVMGLAYTIDSPIRIAKYGISSAISIMDDDLLEKMNRFYSTQFGFPYEEISTKIKDFRAKRITSYLNLVDKIVKHKFSELKNDLLESKRNLEHYIDLLPSTSEVRKELQDYMHRGSLKGSFVKFVDSFLKPGDIDVNIMTKVDKDNFDKNEPLAVEFNDAHAALRGFAQSNLESSVILSAGMNPRLFSYFENFEDFFPNANNELKKKIILKVSDFRSAMIQGSFLAKKGLWVSEYRIESGLNCGGHAFATDGFLMGPILEEFKNKKAELIQTTHELMCKALIQKEKIVPQSHLELKITAQGGVGTTDEHNFLLNKYELNSVGWGSPFLLVPEATSTDKTTRDLLKNATEKDLFLSEISPLGVPFNSVRGSSNEYFKEERIQKGRAGSSCPKKYLALNKDFSDKGLCTASRKYQEIKITELDLVRENISTAEYKEKFNKITEKACLCVGLANASLMENNLPVKGEQQGVVVCPGPNIAYFMKEVSLKNMVQHIYGRENVLTIKDRPHFFIKELRMYRDHFKREIIILSEEITAMKIKKMEKFRNNILDGIVYYKNLFSNDNTYFNDVKEFILKELETIELEINTIVVSKNDSNLITIKN